MDSDAPWLEKAQLRAMTNVIQRLTVAPTTDDKARELLALGDLDQKKRGKRNRGDVASQAAVSAAASVAAGAQEFVLTPDQKTNGSIVVLEYAWRDRFNQVLAERRAEGVAAEQEEERRRTGGATLSSSGKLLLSRTGSSKMTSAAAFSGSGRSGPRGAYIIPSKYKRAEMIYEKLNQGARVLQREMRGDLIKRGLQSGEIKVKMEEPTVNVASDDDEVVEVVDKKSTQRETKHLDQTQRQGVIVPYNGVTPRLQMAPPPRVDWYQHMSPAAALFLTNPMVKASPQVKTQAQMVLQRAAENDSLRANSLRFQPLGAADSQLPESLKSKLLPFSTREQRRKAFISGNSSQLIGEPWDSELCDWFPMGASQEEVLPLSSTSFDEEDPALNEYLAKAMPTPTELLLSHQCDSNEGDGSSESASQNSRKEKTRVATIRCHCATVIKQDHPLIFHSGVFSISGEGEFPFHQMEILVGGHADKMLIKKGVVKSDEV